MCQRITTDGFPHSDTPGSLAIYASPRLFAVNCVLLRLQVPRHPPYALYNLISSHISNVFSKYKELFLFFYSFLLSYYLFLTIKKDNIYLLFGFQRTIFFERSLPQSQTETLLYINLGLFSFSLERR